VGGWVSEKVKKYADVIYGWSLMKTENTLKCLHDSLENYDLDFENVKSYNK
jgi:hypothetical protein